jgi:hypothetical protein
LWYLRFIFIPRETKNSSDSNFSSKCFKYKVTHGVTELRSAVPLTSININCQLFVEGVLPAFSQMEYLNRWRRFVSVD